MVVLVFEHCLYLLNNVGAVFFLWAKPAKKTPLSPLY